MSTASDASAPTEQLNAPEQQCTPEQNRAPRKGALVFIDMQNIFADQDGQWGVSNYAEVEQAMARLRERDGSPVIWTRFVRDPEEHGAWADYYDRWDECRAEPESPVWDLTSPVREGDQVLSMPTFSKWGEQLAEMTKDYDRLVLAGVATDCCVIGTALGAVDAGKWVTVLTDACGGGTKEVHDQAMAIMDCFNPMLTLMTVDEYLNS